MCVRSSKNLVKKLTDFKSKEERKKIEREIMNAATRVADINDQARSANDDEKERLKNSGQEILDKIHDKYPNLTFKQSVSGIANALHIACLKNFIKRIISSVCKSSGLCTCSVGSK